VIAKRRRESSKTSKLKKKKDFPRRKKKTSANAPNGKGKRRFVCNNQMGIDFSKQKTSSSQLRKLKARFYLQKKEINATLSGRIKFLKS